VVSYDWELLEYPNLEESFTSPMNSPRNNVNPGRHRILAGSLPGMPAREDAVAPWIYGGDYVLSIMRRSKHAKNQLLQKVWGEYEPGGKHGRGSLAARRSLRDGLGYRRV
jgi:hypothetical protein